MGGEVFLKSKQNRAGEGGNDLINRRNVSENAEHRGKLEVQRTLKYPPGGIGKGGRGAEGGEVVVEGGVQLLLQKQQRRRMRRRYCY